MISKKYNVSIKDIQNRYKFKLFCYDATGTSIPEFNENAQRKLNEYNTNANAKLTEYNSNHTSKLQEYNDNAQDKIDEYDEHVQELNDEIEYLKDEVNDLSDNQLIAEEEGTEIYVTDAAKARIIFEMTKESSQVTTTGKNLFSLNDLSNVTVLNISRETINNSELKLNGTTNNAGNIIARSTTGVTLKPGTYTLSLMKKSGSVTPNGKACAFYLRNSNGSLIQGVAIDDFTSANKKSFTFTLSEDTEIFKEIYCNGEGYNFNNLILNFQIEEGSTATDYEPYTGGQPSPSPDYPQEVEVVEEYENLFDKDNANIINCLINGTTKVISNYNDAKTLYIPINGGLTYTIYKRVSQRFVVGSCSSIPSNNVTCSVAIQDNSSNKITITTNENDNYLAVFYYLNGVDTLTEQEILNSIMITEGASEHPYVPYGNNYVDVKVTGKNLFDKNNIIAGKYIDANGNFVNDNNNYIGDFIQINNDFSYYVSGGLGQGIRVAYYDIDKNFISRELFVSNKTISIVNNAKYVRLSSYNSNLDTLQLEKGSVATSYEPYQGSIVPIALNGNFIGGKDNNLDELIVDKFGKCYLLKKFFKYIITGNEIWQIHGSIPSWFYCDSLITGYVKNYLSNFILCNYFRQTQYNDVVTLEHGQFCYGNPTGSTVKRIVFKDTNYTTLNDFVSWLQTLYSNGNPVLLYYLLETPQLIDLNYTIDLKTFKGVSNITNSENANMKIRYVQDINSVISEMKNAILEIGGE